MKIPFNKVYKSSKESQYIIDSLNSGRHSGNNKYCQNVISLIKEKHSLEHVFLTTSCTSALEMGAILAGIGPGDEVILPSYTFSSTVNCIINYGAFPVFCEINPKTMNIDSEKIESLITEKTKMILPIDYAGISCEIDKINLIAKKYDLIVMQDCAQSYSSYYKGFACGSKADLATYSFHETKNYNAGGEGGALVVNNKRMVERAFFLQEKGTDRTKVINGLKNKYHWVDKGSSYLLSDILASVLYSQLQDEDLIKKLRSNVTNAYENLFSGLQSFPIKRIFFPEDCNINHHAYWIVFDTVSNKNIFLDELRKLNVYAYIGYIPLHSSPMGKKFGYKNDSLPLTEEYGNKIVRLPFYTSLQSHELEYTVESITKVLKRIYG